MNEQDRKMMAFLAGTLSNLINGFPIDDNDRQQLENIVSELGYYDLDEREFRY